MSWRGRSGAALLLCQIARSRRATRLAERAERAAVDDHKLGRFAGGNGSEQGAAAPDERALKRGELGTGQEGRGGHGESAASCVWR